MALREVWLRPRHSRDTAQQVQHVQYGDAGTSEWRSDVRHEANIATTRDEFELALKNLQKERFAKIELLWNETKHRLGFSEDSFRYFLDFCRQPEVADQAETKEPGWAETEHNKTPFWAETEHNKTPFWAETEHNKTPGWAETEHNKTSGCAETEHNKTPSWAETEHNKTLGWAETEHNQNTDHGETDDIEMDYGACDSETERGDSDDSETERGDSERGDSERGDSERGDSEIRVGVHNGVSGYWVFKPWPSQGGGS